MDPTGKQVGPLPDPRPINQSVAAPVQEIIIVRMSPYEASTLKE